MKTSGSNAHWTTRVRRGLRPIAALGLLAAVTSLARAQELEPHLQIPVMLSCRPAGAAAEDYPGGEACLSRVAVSTEFGSVCTRVCAAHTECPENWACSRIPQGNGEWVGLCRPIRVIPRQHQ